MAWMRFLSFTFNLIGVLFFLAAAATFLLASAVGGTATSNPGDGPVLGAFLGGMIGTLAAAANFLASLAMFFFAAVLWALRCLVEEARRHRGAVTA